MSVLHRLRPIDRCQGHDQRQQIIPDQTDCFDYLDLTWLHNTQLGRGKYLGTVLHFKGAPKVYQRYHGYRGEKCGISLISGMNARRYQQ